MSNPPPPFLQDAETEKRGPPWVFGKSPCCFWKNKKKVFGQNPKTPSHQGLPYKIKNKNRKTPMIYIHTQFSTRNLCMIALCHCNPTLTGMSTKQPQGPDAWPHIPILERYVLSLKKDPPGFSTIKKGPKEEVSALGASGQTPSLISGPSTNSRR